MGASTAVLVSGTGRSLVNLVERQRLGLSSATIDLVVGSKPGLPALDHARRFGIETLVVKPDGITRALLERRIQWVVLAGYLKRWPIPDAFSGRALNIHPSLLPLFGGRGFYGHRVHEAVLASGMRVSGCTVHFVTGGFDEGPIVGQSTVPVPFNDTPEALAARVFEAECALLPACLEAVVTGRIRLEGGRAVSH